MPKGVEVRDLTVGAGETVTKDSIVAVNVREFLRRGDEVSPSPEFGTRRVINLGRRECIAGLRYGIPGMRVGGTRELVIAPHLAYGEAGVPGLIPPNALLRCEVELLEIRKHSASLPQDRLPGKILFVRHYQDIDNKMPGWDISMHENGNLRLILHETDPHGPTKERPGWRYIPIRMDAEKSAELIREAMELPIQIPDCLLWNSGLIEVPRGNGAPTDKRNGARCMVVQVKERQQDLLMIGVHEDSPKLRDTVFFRTIEQLIKPNLSEWS